MSRPPRPSREQLRQQFLHQAAQAFDLMFTDEDDLVTFDQNVSELVPALTGAPDMPALNTGWTYRTFRLDGAVGGGTPRGPKGFLRAKVTATP